jgi:DNA repair exonuclease SbcCD nuclease subunit
MKMMVIGDIHFGVRNNSQSYLSFQEDWFENDLIPKIEKHGIERVLFLGDIFDSRNSLSPVIINSARRIFKNLASKVKVEAIVGNHDTFFRNNKSVHSLTIIEDQGVTVYENMEEVDIGGLKALMLPWVVKDEMEDVQNTLASNDYDLCFGHLEINDFEMVPGVKEDKGFRRDLFVNVGQVFSGHFHLRRKHDNIQYTGTPYELSWSDYQDEKGVYVIDTETKKSTFLPSTIGPKHIKLEEKAMRTIDPKEIGGNIVKLKLLKEAGEVDKINLVERINSLNPISLSIDDESNEDFDVDQDIEASIKDTEGFLNEYINIIEVPEELDKKVLREKLKDLFETCV